MEPELQPDEMMQSQMPQEEMSDDDVASLLGIVTTIGEQNLRAQQPQETDMQEPAPEEKPEEKPQDNAVLDEIRGLKEELQKDDVSAEIADIKKELQKLLKEDDNENEQETES